MLENLEESLAVLRRHLSECQKSLAQEVLELLSIRNDLQAFMSSNWSNSNYSLLLVVSSLVATIQHQIQREARIIRTLTTTSIDTIYSDHDTKRILEVMEQASHALSRASIVEQREFHAAVYDCRLEEYDTAVTDCTDTLPGDDELVVVPAPHSFIPGQVHAGIANYCNATNCMNEAIASAKTLHQVVDVFLQTTPTSSAFATALVVGDSGSGKTYLCHGTRRRLEEAGVHGTFVLL